MTCRLHYEAGFLHRRGDHLLTLYSTGMIRSVTGSFAAQAPLAIGIE